MQFGLGRQITSAHETLSLYSLTTRHLAVPPSQSSLAMLLSLMLLAGLAACGPAASDNPANLGPRARVDGSSLSQQGSSPRNEPFTPAANSVSLASGNATGHASGKGGVTGGDSFLAVATSSMKPAGTLDPLVVPAWKAKELDLPDVGSRTYTLETWAQSAQPEAIDR